jgi:hypothetical protein
MAFDTWTITLTLNDGKEYTKKENRFYKIGDAIMALQKEAYETRKGDYAGIKRIVIE